MGTTCGRLLWENFAISDFTDISVSSEQLQFPKTFLRDPLRSKRWRAQLGWNIDSELNDKLDFTEGTGAVTATIASGNYPTGLLMANAISTAINAAAVENVYFVTYDGPTNKFSILLVLGPGTIDLNWSTGPSAAFTIGKDIGFDVSSDDTGLFTYVGDFAAFGSRSWVKFDFGTVTRNVRALIAFDGNFISTTTITVEANATDVWSSPAFSVTLALDTAIEDFVKAIAFIPVETFRFWRFVIDDPGNPDGFTEMGVPYVGEYQEPSNGFAAAFVQDRNELTAVAFAEEGANFQHVRNTAFRYPLNWLGIPDAEKAKFEEMARTVKIGRPFFTALEPLVDIQNTKYVMLEKPMKDVFMPPNHWRFNTDLREVLG